MATKEFSNCQLNETLPGCQSCRIPNSFPKCNDPYCMTRICEQLNQTRCCDDAWDLSCSLAAAQFCSPEVVPMYIDETSCPLGYVCNEDLTQKALCSEIREIPQMFLMGDIFAGVYCPEGEIGMENCPQGKYCPSPSLQLNCPAGKFCPYKTEVPQISCPACEEGAAKLERDIMLQVVIIGIVIFIAVGVLASIILKRMQHAIAKQVEMLGYRVLGLTPTLTAKAQRDKQSQLDKLRPKLAVIAKRLEDVNKDSSRNIELIKISKTEGAKDMFKFDARGIFDALDKNNDGVLQYSELNAVLDFDDDELKVFVASMNKASNEGMGDSTEDDSVSRRVFVNNFLKALEGTVNLKVTPTEAEAIYDSILEDNKVKEVQESMLYTSVLSNTLSDYEIMLLIKKLRMVHSMDEESPGSNRQELKMSHKGIPREEFILHYPTLLMQVLTEQDKVDTSKGVDICFKDLCLEVTVAKKQINVVNNVTGRLQAKTMTALMGGSGAGKTSLLNALCGRAYYGNIIGDTYINGTKKQIEEIKDVIGFVPQDDVVYAELTVRENLMFAGKLSLPRGTDFAEIEDLADLTLANLGLSRVANSLVGDVKRRGVSGGEKKRVNIGLELMSRPKCLFLDEPTSGLDSSSALLVMSTLKNLVFSEGVTIVTVIHQPRKFIFDLFDSLILLGVGGNTVYSGPAKGAHDYFCGLNYELPPGEALADWLIDISTGQIHPDPKVAATKEQESEGDEQDDYDDDELLMSMTTRQMTEAVGKKGIAMGRANEAITDAALRREWLYKEWKKYFDGLEPEQKAMYEVPPESQVPGAKDRQPFHAQLMHQLIRIALVSYRNLTSKLVDTVILIAAAVIISMVSGLPEMTRNANPDLEFETLVSYDNENAPVIVSELFKYAATIQRTYPLQVGLITAVLVGLQASKILTSKQLEFFRETSSGYDANAYLLAVNIMATLETSVQITLVAAISAMLREPVADWEVFFAHFLAMAWTVVSWSLLFPMIVPAENVGTVLGAFFAFFGLLLSGAVPPIGFDVIYTDAVVEHLAAWLSVTRFFVEGLAASESRCLPEQSGWTVSREAVNFDRANTLMSYENFRYGAHDPNLTLFSCAGWYWGILPSICVGITVRYLGFLAMHGFNRGKQTKKPVLHEIKKDKMCGLFVAFLLLVFLALFSVTTWLYTHDLEADYDFVGMDTWVKTGMEQNETEMMDALNMTALPTGMIPTLLDMNHDLNTLALSRQPLPTGEYEIPA